MAAWLMFWALGIMWGSSFMLIRVGVEVLPPLHLILLRVGIAAVLLWVVVLLRRRPLPRDWRTWASIAVIGIGNNAIPFTLLAYGEQHIESSLASVLQSTTALFGLIVAHFAFADERITTQKVIGLMVGFAGITVLAGRNWDSGEILTGGLLGQLAVIGSSVCYALFTNFSRKVIQGQVEPVVLAATAMLSASFAEMALLGIGTTFFDVPAVLPPMTPDLLLAVLILAVVNTFVAYLMFYEVVKRLGAARATMVTYVVPAVGLLMGVIFLNERLDLFILVGASMIFLGIGIVNLRVFAWLNRRQRIEQPRPAGD